MNKVRVCPVHNLAKRSTLKRRKLMTTCEMAPIDTATFKMIEKGQCTVTQFRSY
jgi:hypothetical protein